ncbi:MAG TPA: hypothetical protein VJB16_01720, partial [archaeon]|nr:hypothetical protein [archaeon]
MITLIGTSPSAERLARECCCRDDRSCDSLSSDAARSSRSLDSFCNRSRSSAIDARLSNAESAGTGTLEEEEEEEVGVGAACNGFWNSPPPDSVAANRSLIDRRFLEGVGSLTAAGLRARGFPEGVEPRLEVVSLELPGEGG